MKIETKNGLEGKDLWMQACAIEGLGTMNQLRDEERKRVEHREEIFDGSKCLIVKLAMTNCPDLEEMSKIKKYDKSELLESLELRAARTAALVRVGYLTVIE